MLLSEPERGELTMWMRAKAPERSPMMAGSIPRGVARTPDLSPGEDELELATQPGMGHAFSGLQIHANHAGTLEGVSPVLARMPESAPRGDASRTVAETRTGHSFGELRIHANRESAGDGEAPPVQVRAQLDAGVVARQGTRRPPRQPRPPQPACPSVTIPLRPVFFSSTQGGSATGATWPARLAAANAVWGKCGLAFTASPARTVVDPAHTTAGNVVQELIDLQLRHQTSGSGPEVFFVDHDLAFLGGGGTHDRGDAAKIMISDRGSNVRLLAHELGHAMGYGNWVHFAPYAQGTIMQPSRSNNDLNPDVVPRILCMMLQWPPNRDPSCEHPDPDPQRSGGAPDANPPAAVTAQ